VKWLSAEIDQELRIFLLEVIERGLATFDGQSWDLQAGVRMDALRFLLLPAIYWRLTGKVTDLSIRVFLRGVKFAFTQGGGIAEREGPVGIWARLEPIFSMLPKPLLDEAIVFGQRIEDPAIRSLCRLFISYRI
jgi:hypothetical protein